MKDNARMMNMFQSSTLNNFKDSQRANISMPPTRKRMIDDNSQSFLPQTQGAAPKKRKVSLAGFSVPLGKSWWRYGEIQKDLIQSIANKKPELMAQPQQQQQQQQQQMVGTQMTPSHINMPSAMYDNTQNAAAQSRVVSIDNLSQPTHNMSLQGNANVSSIIQSLQAKTQSLQAMQQTASLNNATFQAPSQQVQEDIMEHHRAIPGTFFRQESVYQDSAASSIVDDEDDDDCSEDSSGLKFRAYQAENWTEKFEELIEFRDHFNHCLVPNAFPENPALAQWVKRQRYQYKLKIEGKRSTMSDERVAALEEVGFVWDSHSAIWDERLQDLLDYKQANGHCNVPSRYAENRQLAVWVKRQRRQYKFYCEGQPSSMTEERINRLNVIGFEWDLRQKK